MTLAFLQVFRASVRRATIHRFLCESQMVGGVVRVGINLLVDSKPGPGAVRFLCP